MPSLLAGRFEIRKEIGRGSMGTVHHAYDTVLDREVAIKMMQTELHVGSETKERFYREARACARLQHPNIITVYDIGDAGDCLYIVMEFLAGTDWQRLIRDRTPIPAALKIELVAQLFDGLAHAHAHSIVHRDLKPSNVFLKRDQQAKILDFGLARIPAPRLTFAGRILGTPNYMAPEQILGQDCDSRSDLFSAAILSFEFLTGTHPFRAPLIPSRIASGEPEQLSRTCPSLPTSLDPIFQKALAKSPDARYQLARQIAAELRAVSAELPPQPGEVTLEPTGHNLPAADGDAETLTRFGPLPAADDPT